MGLTENNKMKKSDYFVIIAVFTIFKSSKAQEELSKCESAVESCCQSDRGLDFLPINCFERKGCRGLQWLGKEACSPTVLNAINDKKLGNSDLSVRMFSPEFFELKELDTLLKPPLKYQLDENGEVSEANIILMDNIEISLKNLLEERYNRKFSDMKFIEVHHDEDSDEISEIFIKLGTTDKVTLGKFLSEYYFTSIQGNRNALLFGEANVPNESTIHFK